MRLDHLLLFLLFSWICLTSNAYSVSKPGCLDVCGNIIIPYPFGIGQNCYLDKSYEVGCHQNRPYLNSLNAEILKLSLIEPRITIRQKVSVRQMCEDQTIKIADNFQGSPFSYSDNNNVLLVGCGRAMLLTEHNRTISNDCTSWCDPTPKRNHNTYCKVNNCCGFQMDPEFSFSYVGGEMYVNYSNSATGNRSSCSYVFLTSDLDLSISIKEGVENSSISYEVPVELFWGVQEKMLPPEFDLGSHSCGGKASNTTYVICFGFCRGDCTDGNTYVSGGCGHCRKKMSRNVLIMLTAGGTSIGIMCLIMCAIFTKKRITKRRERRRREKFFKRNGGLLLEQLSANVNKIERVNQFSVDDLSKATDNFNENRVLGQGGQGTVFKGMLPDGKIIAIKKSKLENEKQVEHFINEVVILSQIDHRNVVKLLGCCLETEVPLLVYEFVANGTLYDLIHEKDAEFPMPWTVCLRIATEVAAALAHLHSTTSIPVYHRDVKSSNILLDEKYRVKLSDFGTSRHISYEKTHLTTVVRGTFGYMDPQYFQSSRFTEKSDVYSFAVVLLELLTRQKPVSSSQTEEIGQLSLIARFLRTMEEDKLTTIVDVEVLKTASEEELVVFSKLAQWCLNPIGNKRPTMREVLRELEGIKISHIASTIEPSFQGEGSNEADRELVEMSGEFDTCTFSVCDDTF